jgi:octaprenyl-diphosphate synthase
VKSRKLKLATSESPPAENPLHVVESELRAVEAKLRRLLDSSEGLIAEICHYLIDGIGKRMRPAFVLLVYRACGGSDAKLGDAVDAAIALELIHSATLLHDDIVDEGMLRRGKPSAYARYGLGPTLIAGDYLFSRAFELCGRFDEHLVRMAAEACIQLTEGEVMEGRFRRNVEVSFSDYVAVITRKTASLFRSGGRVGSDLAGGSKSIVTAMGELGLAIGLAFQMVDDILDVIGPESKIGKPVGSDLRAGIPSLPVVLGVETEPELRKIFQDGSASEGAGFSRALELLRSPELLTRARAKAMEQTAAARRSLSQLNPSVYRDALAILIDEQIDREV